MPGAADHTPAQCQHAPPTGGFAEPLPDDPAALKAMLRSVQQAMVAQRLEFDRRVQEIYEQVRLARQRMFGRSSESHAGQAWLFDEAEVQALEATEADDVVTLPEPATPTTATSPRKRARGKRKPLPAELPRIEVIHDVPETERSCACGTPMIEIGQEVSEQLDIVPMQIRVLRHIRKRYGCPAGEHAPLSAPAPAQVLPKSNASNDLLATLLATKYVDGLPLARFEYVYFASPGVAAGQDRRVPAEDVIIDPNVLTVATGLKEHDNYAVNFIEATRLIKQELPGCELSGGIGSVLFLPRQRRGTRSHACGVLLPRHSSRAGYRGSSTPASWPSIKRCPKNCSRVWKTCCSIVGPTPRSGWSSLQNPSGGQGAQKRGGSGLATGSRRAAFGLRTDQGDRQIHRTRCGGGTTDDQPVA